MESVENASSNPRHEMEAESTVGGVCPGLLARQGPSTASTIMHLLSARDEVPWCLYFQEKNMKRSATFFAQGPL